MNMRILELTSGQLELLQGVLPALLLRDIEETCEELGVGFEDFAELYSIVMLGAKEVILRRDRKGNGNIA